MDIMSGIVVLALIVGAFGILVLLILGAPRL